MKNTMKSMKETSALSAVVRTQGFKKAHVLINENVTESIRKTAKQNTETRTAVVAERLVARCLHTIPGSL